MYMNSLSLKCTRVQVCIATKVQVECVDLREKWNNLLSPSEIRSDGTEMIMGTPTIWIYHIYSISLSYLNKQLSKLWKSAAAPQPGLHWVLFK